MIFYLSLNLYYFWCQFLMAVAHISNMDICIFQKLSNDKFTPPPRPSLFRLKCPWCWPAAAKLTFSYIAFIIDVRLSSWWWLFYLAYNHEFKKHDSNKGICLLCWSLKEMLGILNTIPISFIEYTILKAQTDQQNVITDIKLKNRYHTIKKIFYD